MPLFTSLWGAFARCGGPCHAALLFGAAVLAGSWLPAFGAAQVDVDAARNGDLVEVRALAAIDAPLALVWSTLTDYERLPEFIPGLKKSRVISRAGATATVEQSGEARFLFLAVPIDVTVESTERPPNIEVRRVAGTLRHLQGRYETELLSNPPRVQLRWIGSIASNSDLPALIGEALIRLLIEQQFVAMVREIERREAARRQGTPVPAGK